MLVDRVANDLLLFSLLGLLELVRNKHLLDLVEVALGVVAVSILRSSWRSNWASTNRNLSHALIQITWSWMMHHALIYYLRWRSMIWLNTSHVHWVASVHHVLLLTHHVSVAILITSVRRTLEVGPVVHILPLLIVASTVQSGNPWVVRVVGLRALLIVHTLVELESRLQEHGEQVDQILGAA